MSAIFRDSDTSKTQRGGIGIAQGASHEKLELNMKALEGNRHDLELVVEVYLYYERSHGSKCGSQVALAAQAHLPGT